MRNILNSTLASNCDCFAADLCTGLQVCNAVGSAAGKCVPVVTPGAPCQSTVVAPDANGAGGKPIGMFKLYAFKNAAMRLHTFENAVSTYMNTVCSTLFSMSVIIVAADFCRVVTVDPSAPGGVTVSAQACTGTTCPYVPAGQACLAPETGTKGQFLNTKIHMVMLPSTLELCLMQMCLLKIYCLQSLKLVCIISADLCSDGGAATTSTQNCPTGNVVATDTTPAYTTTTCPIIQTKVNPSLGCFAGGKLSRASSSVILRH